MFERLGPLVFEPWLDRVADFGACGEVTLTGEVRVAAPHRLSHRSAGRLHRHRAGARRAPGHRRSRSVATATAARPVAAETGYRGRFAVDAFAYRDGSAQHLHALCELNARTTFGWIRARARRPGSASPGSGSTRRRPARPC